MPASPSAVWKNDLIKAKQDLAESTEECSALSRHLKQLAHATEARPQPKRRREPAPATADPLPTTDVSLPRNPNEENAADFLRKIEEERARPADSGNS